jgi:hypothetical protein
MNTSSTITFIETLSTHWLDVFPLAVGWYIVIGIILLTFIFIAYLIKTKKKNYTRYALHLLDDILLHYKKDKDLSHYLQQINALLKKVSIKVYGRNDVSFLSGEQWISFINQHADTPLSTNDAYLLQMGPYNPNLDGNHKSLHQFVQTWIIFQFKKHENKAND